MSTKKKAKKLLPGWKRILLLADQHCGHWVGLTPPSWQWRPNEGGGEDTDSPFTKIRTKFASIQQEAWNWYCQKVTALQPIHLVINVGDAIDGRGSRSGSTELLATDREEQTDMAVMGLRIPKAKNYCIVRGTPYHTGDIEDWENTIAEKLRPKPGVDKVTIGNHEWPEVNGVIFDVKHYIGRSGIPHGRATPLLRDELWNVLWSEAKEQPRADVLVRAHVHYYHHSEFMRGQKVRHVAILPALQGQGSKYGSKFCSNTVDFGFCYVDVGPQGEIQWKALIAPLKSQQAQVSTF